jgi:CspA family cold shock protein
LNEINEQEQNKPVKARLKWFNYTNGFGFLNPENNEDIDAFIHVTTLQKAGIDTLGDHAVVLCYIEHSLKGALVTEILELIEVGSEPKVIPDKNKARRETHKMEGAVKWFSEEKGFGFAIAADDEKDIFIHQTCLERCQLTDISAGMRVVMDVQLVDKGREAINIQRT